MDTVRNELILMIQLQQIYDRVAEAIRERSTDPPEVRELQEENRRRREELKGLEDQVAAHQEELREVRKREEECKLELEHFQRQKGMVTNEREFTAVISEIDYATRAMEEKAARREQLETAIADLSREIEDRREARPEEEAVQRNVTASWDERKESLKQEVHDLALEARALEEQLAPAHRARFLRLLKSKKGTAMAAVVDGSCSLCHFALRPHLQQRVRRCQELIACEHCHRILYFSDLAEATVPAEP